MSSPTDNPKKSEKQKMLDGELYDATSREILDPLYDCKEILYDFNQLRPKEFKKREEIIKKLFKKTGNKFYFESPFYCDLGFNITIGENFYANHNLVILDEAEVIIGDNVSIGPNVGIYTAGHPIDIETRNKGLEYAKKIKIGNNVWIGGNVCIMPGVTIGDNVFIGPNVGIYTAGHPIDVETRNKGLEYAKKITIGNNVWIGGNVCIMPGVTIGDNVTIGAGAVVTKNIPSNVTAFGNPCKVYTVNEENIGKK